jgi:hypothetical protein
MGRGQTAILVQACTRFLQRLSAKIDSAFRLCFQKPEALCRGVVNHPDDVIATHCHVAVILQPQALDWRAVAAVRIYPLSCINLTQVAGADLWRLGQLVSDKLGGLWFAQTRQHTRDPLFRGVMVGHCRRGDLNANGQVCRPLRYYVEVVIADRGVG